MLQVKQGLAYQTIYWHLSDQRSTRIIKLGSSFPWNPSLLLSACPSEDTNFHYYHII